MFQLILAELAEWHDNQHSTDRLFKRIIDELATDDGHGMAGGHKDAVFAQ